MTGPSAVSTRICFSSGGPGRFAPIRCHRRATWRLRRRPAFQSDVRPAGYAPSQRGDKPDSAVAAHIQKTGVVEENHASGGRRRDRFAQQRADQYVIAARFKNGRLTPMVEVAGEASRRSAMLPSPRSGKPSTIRRVGSPPVCESIALSVTGAWRGHQTLRKLTTCFIMLAQPFPACLSAFVRENDEICIVISAVYFYFT